MSLDSLLKAYANDNLLANTKLVNWLDTKPLELMTTVVPSSFPSIRLTLLHIWDVEDGWLADLASLPAISAPMEHFKGSMAELYASVLNKSAEFAAYVHRLSTSELLEFCVYERFDGQLERRARFEMIQHCMNHSTFHRGQIVTIAHQLGLTDAPWIDFMLIC